MTSLLIICLQVNFALEDNTTYQDSIDEINLELNNLNSGYSHEITYNKNDNLKTYKTNNLNTTDTYQDLSDNIRKSKESQIEINLTRNTEYQITHQIYVNKDVKNIIINGNNATINGNNSDLRFLYINKGYSVTLNNIIIKNIGNGSQYGGAIFNAGNLTINNSIIESNSGQKGGSIYNTGQLSLIKTDLTRNNASNGGVIYSNNASITISHCNFKNNNAYNDDSGAIQLSNFSNGSITNSNFINNYASIINNNELAQAGAIKVHTSNLTIKNSVFKNNSAQQSGGALFVNNGNISISNSLFDNNHAHKEDGGAIQITINSFASINRCNFTNNYVTYSENKSIEDPQAGAVKVYYSNATIKNSLFENNSAEHSGGAMFLNTCNTTIDNCTFRKNNAYIAGSIRIGTEEYSRKTPPTANITIIRSVFESNQAIFQGGAIFTGHYIYLKVSNCTFNNNSASLDDGGAIEISINGTGLIEKSIFVNNTAGNLKYDLTNKNPQAGAVKIYYANATLKNNSFINNMAAQSGGAIHVNTGNMTSSNNIFKSNNATFGGVIRVNNEKENINYIKIENDSYYENSALTNGGVLYITDKVNVSIKNSNFTRNTVGNDSNSGRGGVIYQKSCDITLINNMFFKNHANSYGGSIYLLDNNTLYTYNNSFINNTSSKSGGAIHNNNNSKLNINKTNFINNTAINKGGALFTNNNETITITNSIFNNNKPEDYTPETENKTAIIKIKTPKNISTGQNTTINLTVTDKNSNTKLNGKAVIKIDGLTIKDSITNQSVIEIKNGVGTLNLLLAGYSGRNYTLTAVFSKTGYNRAENTTKLYVKRSLYNKFTYKLNATSEENIKIKQILKDTNGNQIYGISKVAIKLGDRTVKTIEIKDGQLDTTVTVPYLPPGENKFIITLGENYRYETLRINSTITISKQNVTAKINQIKAQAGQKIVIKAVLINNKTKTNVISGKYIFKVDGKTIPLIKNNTEVYTTQSIQNGTAQWTYTLPDSMKKGTYDITIAYNGNTQSNSLKYSTKALTIT